LEIDHAHDYRIASLGVMESSKRLPWASFTLVLIVVGCSLLAWKTVGYPLTADSAGSVGARHQWSLQLGQLWRLISAACLHMDAPHLLWNLLPSLPFLVLLERRMSAGQMVALVLLGAVFGHACGAIFSGGTSVGFSPSLFAVIAAFIVTQGERSPQLVRLATIYLGVGLVASLRLEGVDIGSHIGGLGAGIVGGLMLRHGCSAASLLLLALLPIVAGLPLADEPSQTWDLETHGLLLEISGAFKPSTDTSTRCIVGSATCLTVKSRRVARRAGLAALDGHCFDSQNTRPNERCLLQNSGRVCSMVRRGLYQHSVCLVSKHPKALRRWTHLLRGLTLIPPHDDLEGDAKLIEALRAHRLGETQKARDAYRVAMLRSPDDARLTFLAALLEVDFADNLERALLLAERAAALDPKHPDGRALLREIKERLRR
jgi:membrane associated rhomboid family serine protease